MLRKRRNNLFLCLYSYYETYIEKIYPKLRRFDTDVAPHYSPVFKERRDTT